MSETPVAIPIPYDAIRAFCERNHIRRLALFGSVLRDDFGPDSDVDMLVEFVPGARITLFDMEAMQVELSDRIGRPVDLRTPQELHLSFRDSVHLSSVPLYER
jgi:predicted nucleotidyltransferase